MRKGEVLQGEEEMNVTKGEAIRVLNQLQAGTLGAEPWVARELHVGREEYVEWARGDLLSAREHGTSPVRFVVGRHGDGKSHFLQAVLGCALEERFWTCYLSLEREVGLRLESEMLWRDFVRRLYIPECRGQRLELPAALKVVVERAGMERIRTASRSSSVDPDLGRAIVEYVSGESKEREEELREWLLGGAVRPKGIARKIDALSAVSMLESLTAFVRELGYAGIVVAIDEVERGADFTERGRRGFYEGLRQLIDRQTPGYCAYLASTVDGVIDVRKGMASHQPLWQRVQYYTDDLKRRPAPGVPLVGLRALREEELIELARRVRELHGTALKWEAERGCPDEVLERVVRELVAAEPGPEGVRPRRLVQRVLGVLTDEMGRGRGGGGR
jgi:hypothetical protein